MIKHILTLTWNRRWANSLLMLEVIIAFVALFALVSVSYHFWSNYQRPLGFNYDDAWELAIRIDGRWQDKDAQTLQGVLSALNALPNIEKIHAQSAPAFRNWSWTTTLPGKQGNERTYINLLSEGAPDTLGIELVEGRWPHVGEWQGRQERDYVVAINQHARSKFFDDDENAINQVIVNGETEVRVVGVFKDYRQRGEFAKPVSYVIGIMDIENPGNDVTTLFVKVAKGTPVSYEETILNTAKSMAPEWDMGIVPWHELRERQHANVLTPLRIAIVLATFFLLMLAMGLIGVLWQDVLRRTQEIGLRRALGAPANNVRLQIIGEMLAVTGLGILIGTILAVQLPMLELDDTINWQTTPIALIISSLIILVLATFAAYYPSYIAGRYTPSEALRYE